VYMCLVCRFLRPAISVVFLLSDLPLSTPAILSVSAMWCIFSAPYRRHTFPKFNAAAEFISHEKYCPFLLLSHSFLNPLVGTLKPHINGPLYSNTVIGTLAVDGLLHLVQRGGAWASCGPAQSFPRCTKCNIPSING